jgi:hypothetical protein
MRTSTFLKKIPLIWYVAAGAILGAVVIALTHPAGAIVSFDEGFHGGAATFFSLLFRQLAGLPVPEGGVTYLTGEFRNGITLYPPLWSLLAGWFGFIFGPSTILFRNVTLLFYVGVTVWSFWFVRLATKQVWPALLSAALIATVPMVVIYSHLMMREVPQLVAITLMVGMYFAYTTGALPRTLKNFALLLVVFVLGALAKLPVLPVALAVVVAYSLFASILFWRERAYRWFVKPELLLLPLLAAVVLAAYIKVTDHYLHDNMIRFFIDQSQGITRQKEISPLAGLLAGLWNHREFYLRDFRHIPVLSFLWVASTVGYAVWKRTPLSLLLVVWGAGVYMAFSAVSPQVPQYVMAIYVPLVYGTALFLSEVVNSFRSVTFRGRATIFAALLVGIPGWQLMSIPKSEAYGWRYGVTGGDEAAADLAALANPGDRVMVWHDGITYAVRVEGLAKQLQIVNAVNPICAQAAQDSFEWALSIAQPPAPTSESALFFRSPAWQVAGQYGAHGDAILYHNTATRWPLRVRAAMQSPQNAVSDGENQVVQIRGEDSAPQFWGCYRTYPLGDYMVTVRFKISSISDQLADDAGVIQFRQVPVGGGVDLGGRVVTAGELRAGVGTWQEISFPMTKKKMNQQSEATVSLLQPTEAFLDWIEYSRQ